MREVQRTDNFQTETKFVLASPGGLFGDFGKSADLYRTRDGSEKVRDFSCWALPDAQSPKANGTVNILDQFSGINCIVLFRIRKY